MGETNIKNGLIGYLFDEPSGRWQRFIWRIRKWLGLKVKHYGVPIVVSDKVKEDYSMVVSKK